MKDTIPRNIIPASITIPLSTTAIMDFITRNLGGQISLLRKEPQGQEIDVMDKEYSITGKAAIRKAEGAARQEQDNYPLHLHHHLQVETLAALQAEAAVQRRLQTCRMEITQIKTGMRPGALLKTRIQTNSPNPEITKGADQAIQGEDK